MMRTTIALAVSVVCVGLGMSCAETKALGRSVEARIDCKGICERYATCYDVNYDTGTCQAQCRSEATKDNDFARKADICNSCINGTACMQTSAACGSECSPVVPLKGGGPASGR